MDHFCVCQDESKSLGGGVSFAPSHSAAGREPIRSGAGGVTPEIQTVAQKQQLTARLLTMKKNNQPARRSDRITANSLRTIATRLLGSLSRLTDD